MDLCEVSQKLAAKGEDEGMKEYLYYVATFC